MSLKEYKAKRNFSKTPEPTGDKKTARLHLTKSKSIAAEAGLTGAAG